MRIRIAVGVGLLVCACSAGGGQVASEKVAGDDEPFVTMARYTSRSMAGYSRVIFGDILFTGTHIDTFQFERSDPANTTHPMRAWVFETAAAARDRYEFRSDPFFESIWLAFLQLLAPGGTVRWLDVGGGSGAALAETKRELSAAVETTLIDRQHSFFRDNAASMHPSPRVRAALAEPLLQPDHSFEDDALTALRTLDDDAYDLVTLVHSLQYMADAEAVLTEVLRVTRPGGHVFIRASVRVDTIFRKTPRGARAWLRRWLAEHDGALLATDRDLEGNPRDYLILDLRKAESTPN